MSRNDDLPWEQSERVVSLFREVTKNKILLYGSTTAIKGTIRNCLSTSNETPEDEDGRIHIALSSMTEKIPKNYLCMSGNSLEILTELTNKYPSKSIVIVGGMNLFSQFLGYCHNFYINVLMASCQGDMAFNSSLFDYIRSTSAEKHKETVPELPTYAAIEMYHFKRSIH